MLNQEEQEMDKSRELIRVASQKMKEKMEIAIKRKPTKKETEIKQEEGIETTLQKNASKLAINIVSIAVSFVSSFFVSGFVCLAYNKIVSNFGFFQILLEEEKIPLRISYVSILFVCWAIVGIRTLFIKGE